MESSLTNVTALICAYNAAKTIKRAIDSVVGQVEGIIVIDDGSEDGTVDVIERLNDPKITLIQSPVNQGIGASRQMALEECKTKYAIWVDSDDECLANRIKTLLPFVEQGAGWVYDSIELFDGHTNSFSKNLMIPDFLHLKDGLLHQLARNYIPSIGFPMINVSMARRIGFDPSFRHGEDYDHFLRALASGGKIALSHSVTHRMYDYPSSLSRQLGSQNQFVELGMKKLDLTKITELMDDSSLSDQEQLSILLLRLLKLKHSDGLLEVISRASPHLDEENVDFKWLVFFSKGMLGFFSADYATAIEEFQKAANIRRTADVCNNLGVLSELLGESGHEYFEKAIELFPGYLDALTNLKGDELCITSVPLRSHASRNSYIK